MSFGIDGAHLPSGLPDPPAHNDGRQCGGRRSEIRWKRTLFLGRSLRRLAHLLGGIKGCRSTEGGRTEESAGVAALTRAGGRQAGHRSWSRSRGRRFRFGRMRMVAALAGAGTVLAAAGALRAIPVVAALGADRTLGVPVLAADEAVAAVELDSIGGFEQTAEVARSLAAVAFGDAFIDAANLTDEAGDLQASAFEAEIAVRAVGII